MGHNDRVPETSNASPTAAGELPGRRWCRRRPAGGARRHRDVRGGKEHGGQRTRRPRMVRGRQHAALPSAAHGGAGSTGQGRPDRLRRRLGGLRIAAVADVRGGEFFGDLQAALSTVKAFGIEPRLVFLEADDDTLVRRFESSRRPHPLQGEGRLVDGIAAERSLLASLRESADLLIDTSPLNVHQLRTRIETALGHGEARPVQITVMSFGFKYGLPVDADFVADCRFLPNPYWVPELRPLTGEDTVGCASTCSDSLMPSPSWTRYEAALRIALEGYRTENKRYATVALGCTGGKHRSVALSAELGRRIASESVSIRVVHRDLGRE